MRAFSVRVAASTCGRIAATRPANSSPGNAAVLTVITGWDYLRVGLKHMD